MMSKLFAIYAYENLYDGLHGKNVTAVVEALNEEEAKDYAKEMAYGVIDSCSDIIESFQDDAESKGLEKNTDEYDEFILDCINEDICYDIYPIVKETNLSLEALNDKFYNNPSEFLKEFCNIDRDI